MSYRIEYFSPHYNLWLKTDPDGPVSYIGEPTLKEVVQQYAQEFLRRRRPRALSESQIRESREYFLEYWVRKKLCEAVPSNRTRCRFLDLEGRTIRVIHSDSLVCSVPDDEKVRSLVEFEAKGGLSTALTKGNDEDSGAEGTVCICLLSLVALVYFVFSNSFGRSYVSKL